MHGVGNEQYTKLLIRLTQTFVPAILNSEEAVLICFIFLVVVVVVVVFTFMNSCKSHFQTYLLDFLNIAQFFA